MTILVKHSKVSTIPDDTDTSLVRPSDWNADHTLTGTIDVTNGGTGASTLTGYVKGNGTSAMTAVATVPSTDITGLGTMSTQNANAVAITGGTINGTTIGATTPAAGTFTTLEATDTLTLNKTNAATAKVWSNTNSSPIADLEFQRGTGTVWGDDAFTDYRVRASSGNFIIQSKNSTTSTLDLLTVDETNNAIKFSPVGVEQMRVTRTASAVNYVQVTGAATTASPAILVQGSDTNISADISTKGSGSFSFRSYGGTNRQFRIDGSPVSVNYIQVAGAATGADPVISAQGSNANINLVFTPKGSGTIKFGTYTAGILAQTGYITITDSSGTSRRLLVG